MSRDGRTVTLTERRSVDVRLPRADVAELARSFRHVVDVRPTFDRGVYRVVARGYVGHFRTTGIRWVVRPKLPWDGFVWLASAGRPGDGGPAGEPADWSAAVVAVLADRLAGLIRERAAAGLVRDYAEQESESGTVRGRIDFARQARDPVRAAGRFHLVADEFTPDVVWNRAPKAAARRLLAADHLPASARTRLAAAVDDLHGVGDGPVAAADLDRLPFDGRTATYRPLIDLSRLVLAGTPAAGAADGLLVNLEQLFEAYVTAGLLRHARPGCGWSVTPQGDVPLVPRSDRINAVALRPDLVVRDAAGAPRSVWDVKWKALDRSGPAADDVHQELGYAAALGVRTAGLVYPGRRFAVDTWAAAGGRVTLHAVRLRLVGPTALRDRAVARLAWLAGRGGADVP